MAALSEDIETIATTAAGLAPDGATLSAVLAAEPAAGERAYLCGFVQGEGRLWLVLDGAGVPVLDRQTVRDVVAIAALCELAAESAFPGDLSALIVSLRGLAESEAPDGIAEAITAAQGLAALLDQPAVASAARLDAIGAAAHRLEAELSGAGAGSPFSSAMRSGSRVIEDLLAEVEGRYLGTL